MSVDTGFNRTMERLSGWFRWQLGVIQGRAQPAPPGGFRPSFATGAMVLAALAYQVVSGGLLLVYYQPSVYSTLTPCGQAAGLPSTAPAASSREIAASSTSRTSRG